MKRATLVIIIIASVLVVLGVGMIAVSGAIYGSRVMDSIRDTKNEYRITESATMQGSAATVKSIDIDMINSPIQVIRVPGDTINISYSKRGGMTYQVIESENKLAIKETKKGFDFMFSFLNSITPSTPVVIEVPESASLENVQLRTTNGKIEIEQLKTITLGLNTVNGEMTVEDCDLDALDADSTNGSLNAYNSKMRAIRMKTVNGGISVDDVDALEIRLDTVNGGLSATGLPGRSTDYAVRADTVNGSVNINGIKVSSRGNYSSNNEGTRIIDVKTVNGGITISTVQK